jgi:hypothetical protein
LIGAGLFTRSLLNLVNYDPGFRAEHLITFSVDTSLSGYSQERSLSFFRELQDKLASLPGVQSAVMREVGWLVVIGACVGLPLSYVPARYVESQLFGIHAHDPWVLLGATVVIVFVALLAGAIPAVRAMRIEPIRALKYE